MKGRDGNFGQKRQESDGYTPGRRSDLKVGGDVKEID